MTDAEILELRNKAKCQVRKAMDKWIETDLEMKKTMLKISDALIRGIIDMEVVDSVFKRRLVSHIACNDVNGDNILKSAIYFELLQEVFMEEVKALQN